MKSGFKMDDMDIELSLPNEDDEEEMKPENVSSLSGNTKFIVYKSSLEQPLPSQCLLWKPQAGNWLCMAFKALLYTSSLYATNEIANGNGLLPFSGMMPWGVLVFAATILFLRKSGQSHQHINVCWYSVFQLRSYFPLQQLYLVPAVFL